MKKNTLLIMIVLAVLALASIAANGGRKFTTTLTGAAEVPGPGDPDGSGTAKITLNYGQGEVCWEIGFRHWLRLTLLIFTRPVCRAGPLSNTLSPDARGFSSDVPA